MTDGDLYKYYAGANLRNVWSYSREPIASISLPDAFACGFSDLTFSDLDAPEASLYELYTSNSGCYWTGLVTPAWLAAAGTTSFTVPDFSDVDGWQAAWELSPNDPPAWVYATMVEYNSSLRSYLLDGMPTFAQAPRADGDFTRWSSVHLAYND